MENEVGRTKGEGELGLPAQELRRGMSSLTTQTGFMGCRRKGSMYIEGQQDDIGM